MGCTVDGIENRFRSVAFIIFNYDRCIEHYLYCSLQNYYRINASRTAELINQSIYHPYGTAGSLPWLDPDSPDRAIAYGVNPNPTQLFNLVSQIKTFTEV